MNIFPFFNEDGQVNSYIVELNNPSEAILIDIGDFSHPQIKLIEEKKYKIVGIFLTHCHRNHLKGLIRFERIYQNVKVYSYVGQVGHYEVIELKDKDTITLGDSLIEVIGVPGHSIDSLVYKIEHTLFTGDTLASGQIGSTKNEKDKIQLVNNINERLMDLNPAYLVFPGHGCISKIRIEKYFNHDLLNSVVSLIGQ